MTGANARRCRQPTSLGVMRGDELCGVLPSGSRPRVKVSLSEVASFSKTRSSRPRVCSMVPVPDEADEDARRFVRERTELVSERARPTMFSPLAAASTSR
jgi:hypothetical protein